jgi:aminobenzoyl-glutamate utilization protein B
MVAAYGVMTETFAKVSGQGHVRFSEHLIGASRGYLGNDVMGRHLMDALEIVGTPNWSPEDIAWMEELSRNCAPDSPFVLHQSLDYYDTGIDYYVQDDGDISWRIPLGRVNWAYPETVPIHHWAWTALSGHSASTPGPMMASEALAIAAVQLVSTPSLIEDAKRELSRRTEGVDIAPPLFGTREILASDPAAFWDASWT